MFTDVVLHALEADDIDATGQIRTGIDRAATKIFGASLANRAVAFERQTEDIETRVAGTADRIGAVLRQKRTDGQVGLRLIVRQFGNHGRRRRNHLAEHAADEPVAALHRTGTKTGGILRHEDCHRNEAAALVLIGVIDADPDIGLRFNDCGRLIGGRQDASAGSTGCSDGARDRRGGGRRWRRIGEHLHAVVLREHLIDKCVVAVEKVIDGAVIAYDVLNEADGLLEHSLAEVVRESGEALAVDAVVVFEAPEFEPVAAELGGEAFGAVVFQHAASLREQDDGILQIAGCGVLQQFLVRHAAPEEVAETAGEGVAGKANACACRKGRGRGSAVGGAGEMDVALPGARGIG